MTLDGRWELTGSLDPLGGETVATALRLAAVDEPDVLPAKDERTRWSMCAGSSSTTSPVVAADGTVRT